MAQRHRAPGHESAACPSPTRGRYAVDFGDTAHLTPLTKTHTLGSTFTPPGFHAGGLRDHGMAPLVSHRKEPGLIEANHAAEGAIVEALRCKAEGRSAVILFNRCGHGHFDMSACGAYSSSIAVRVWAGALPAPIAKRSPVRR